MELNAAPAKKFMLKVNSRHQKKWLNVSKHNKNGTMSIHFFFSVFLADIVQVNFYWGQQKYRI